ncbi:uncharacterized protein LOC136085282 [Hydra vulgaris]|uniref:ATP-dependent DNA helicase n=1 Tax=Hydra vulgaris TaxID=6087 RepID=A0ABM4CLI6_HYDVU
MLIYQKKTYQHLINNALQFNSLYPSYHIAKEAYSVVLNLHELKDCTRLILIYKDGFDSATGKSVYKQQSDDTNEFNTDISLFITCFVTLELCCFKDEKKQDGTMKEVVVQHIVNITMEDGKIHIIISTATNYYQYYLVCGASPTEMNNLSLIVQKKKTLEGNIRHGVSTLDLWIRILEYCRYVSAPEALWRIFEYPISHMSHTIIRLKVHLPENQIVYFREGEEQVALDRSAQRDTHLTAWFKLNSENEGAHRYSYVDIPYHFVFDDKPCKWKAKGATSWADLRTINGIVLETFREACVFKDLLQDDTEWQNTLSEAVLTRMPKQIRVSVILTFCELDNPSHLWNTYKAFMMEDFNHRQVPFILAEQATLRQIEKIINQSGKTLSDYNLPVVDKFIDFNLENLNDNVQQSIDEANRMLLNVNQLNVSNTVLAALNEQPSVENQHSRLFFMDRPAGSGKTFTYNYLVAETISRGFKSATAAWTGIAATLLTNGSTLHGLFKLPVPILDNSTCNVTPNSIHGHFLKQVSLFLLDETSMIPKHALNAIDRLLKDVCNNNFPFGGKVILFGGDLRQILPIVKRGQPVEIVESCIKCSLQWRWVQKFTLTENMRVHDGEREFSQWLLKLGSGTMPVKEVDPFKGCIEIPNQCIIRENKSIVEKIADQNDYSKRVILTPTNVDSLSINEEVLECLPGEVKIYVSADQIDTDDLNERNNFPVEFLNSLTPSGMPPHCLKLKIGCVIILLRNLDLKAGLCNGA